MLLHEDFFSKFDQGRIDVFFSAARRLSPNLPSCGAERTADPFQFARLLESMDLFDGAIRSYRAAIAENPKDPTAYLALAALFLRLGLFHSVKRVYRELLGIEPHLDPLRRELADLEREHPDRAVSFYLPCYNVARYIEATLAGIFAQSHPTAEILIIDDGCTDETIRIAQRFPVKVIAHSANKGLAAARNTALEHAAGEFLASCDTDAVPDPFWLERLMLSFTAEDVAGTGGRLIEKNTVTAVDRWRQLILKQDHGDAAAENISLFGCNTVFRVAALRQVGGYNERFRTNFEDMDICNRLRQIGLRTRYNPEAVCRHHRVDSLSSAANTIYNWQKPVWEACGAFEDLDLFKRRNIECLRSGIEKVVYLIDHGCFEALYVSFLATLRSLLKDLIAFQERNGTPMQATFLAACLGFVHLMRRSGHFSDRLIAWLMEDIGDLLRVMLGIENEAGLATFRRDLLDQVGRCDKLSALFEAYCLFGKIHAEFLFEMLDCLKPLLRVNPLIARMIQTSAWRIRHEAEQSPYAPERRVMLLNPPWRQDDRRGVRAGSRWPFTSVKCDRPASASLAYLPYPFFLGYLCSLLKERRIVNVLVDAIAEELGAQEFLERVAGYEPEVIVMEISTASYRHDCLWLLQIKAALPRAKVIWVGPHATTFAETILRENPYVDYVVRGEYEQTAADLIERLVADRGTDGLKGLVARSAAGEVVNTGPAPLIADLDRLPWPERLTVPIYKYNDLVPGMRYPSVQLHASRGCPFGCIYCVWPQVLYGGKNYRTRSPKAVMDELEQVVQDFGFVSAYFDDDTFNIGKKRILDLCGEFARRDVKIAWSAMARADTSDFETLAAMKNAGMVGIKFGVESGVQQLVDRAEKGLDLEKVATAVEDCRRLGIRTHLTFTFGLPGETWETIRRTIAFARRMNSDSIQFSITTPFPGTKYFNRLKESGNLLSEDWEQFDGNRYTVIRTEALTTQDLQAALRLAHQEYAQQRLESQSPPTCGAPVEASAA